jgi:hypothetical protein
LSYYFFQGVIVMKSLFSLFLGLSVVSMIAGCGRPQGGPGAMTSDSPYRLKLEPSGATDVLAVKETAKDSDEVTIVGRIGGDAKPWVDGIAAFTVVDLSLKPCDEKEGCETPWDYCCDVDATNKGKAMIKVVDKSGNPVTTDARQLLAVKELNTVVVRGKAKRDDAGNLTVLAEGVFVRP